jgi:MauM/NapG family ferredoxin protein
LTPLRRAAQTVLLLLFLGLLLMARPTPAAEPAPWWKAFFWFDPLLLIATWLAAHAVPLAALAGCGTIVLTVLLGRVFCGWMCPLGTVHAAAGWVIDRAWPNRNRRDHWSPWQRGKYYLLAGFLAMAVFGGHWVTIFDPLVLLYRSVTTAVVPGAQWVAEEGSTAIYQADPGIGRWRVTAVTEPAYRFLQEHVFVTPRQAFLGGGVILAFFVATVILNAYRRRFWCRYLCPLGALLGLFAWRPLLRRHTAAEDCTQCDLCARSCQGAAGIGKGEQWVASECLACFHCSGDCPRTSLGFTWAWPWRRQPAVATVDLSKRSLLASLVGGIAGLWLMRANPQSRGSVHHPRLIRPPGARAETDFLARCTACGLCMKVCPTGGLHPAWTEAGLEGLWTPRLVPQVGHCDYTCTLCGQVCPTQAIVPLTVQEKQQVRIGLASFDTTRCLPYAYGRDCMVCEEHCPIPDKAIYSVPVEVTRHDGQKAVVKQPRVDATKCIGCGICEHVCPFKDRPAIRVSSANESRTPAAAGRPGNQPILPDAAGDEDPYNS